MAGKTFAQRAREGEPQIGYWCVLDSPVSTERVARLGYDYVALDAQHGLMGYSGWLNGMMAIDAAAHRSTESPATGIVRVPENNATLIGQALDAGAEGVIVPMINTAEEAARAVAACRYPPTGIRSYGPMRSGLRVGPIPAIADKTILCLAMIDTPAGLENVREICLTPGLDGIYVGPSDLRLAIGGSSTTDKTVDAEFDSALDRILAVAHETGIVAAIHTPDGETAARRLAQGFTMVTIASDLVHLETSARQHLKAAKAPK